MVSVAVVVVAEKINEKLSFVGPPQLSLLTIAALTSPDDAVRRVTFEGVKFDDPTQSVAEQSTLLMNTIRASFVMETARFILYWGSTDLVLFI